MKKSLILLIAAAFMVISVMPAAAASQVSFYGQSWFEMWWDKDDAISQGIGFNDTDLQWTTDGAQVSRFGARFKDGPMSGLVEIGHGGGTGIRTRHIYGEYDFGGFKLLVGQTYEKSFLPFLAGARGGQGTYRGEGGIGTRTPMIRARFAAGPGELSVAAITPTTSNLPGGVAAASVETDTNIPRLELAYDVKVSNFRVQLVGTYQTYDIVQLSTNKDWDITSYAMIGKVTADFGPFSVFGGLYSGQNLQEFGMPGTKPARAGTVPLPLLGAADWSCWFNGVNSLVDTDYFGWALGVKFKVNDMLALSAGYGKISVERDSIVVGQTGFEDDDKGFHLSAFVTVAKNFEIDLEYGVKDWGNYTPAGTLTAIDEGKSKYWGAEWILKF